VRVTADQGALLIAPRATVQDRDARDGIGDLRQLREGQVAMSALTPGERAGEEAPARAPTIRFGMRGAQGEGLFVVDYRAQEMLDRAAQEAGWDRSFFRLLDERGYRLTTPRRKMPRVSSRTAGVSRPPSRIPRSGTGSFKALPVAEPTPTPVC
jgi:hypothetical protein